MDDEIEVIGKVADATTEVAKTGAKAIDSTDKLAGFVYRIIGEPIEIAAGTFLTDPLKELQKRRLRSLQIKTEKFLNARGIEGSRRVMPKVAVPLLENATLEEDDDLQSLWASLLASALDSDASMVERKYVSVLADLTADDVYALSDIYSDWNDPARRMPSQDGTLTYGEGVDGTAGHNAISVVTLNRLGLIAPSYVEFKTYEPPGQDHRYGDYGPFSDPVRTYGDLEAVVLTPFGEAFCKAVIPNLTPDE